MPIDKGYSKRQDGITMLSFSNERSFRWDAACTGTYVPTNIYRFAVSVGHAARKVEKRKVRGACACFRFEHVTVNTASVYGESTAALISEMGRCITEATGERKETLWLEQRLGLAFVFCRDRDPCSVSHFVCLTINK